jgi:DNA-directed RNA polymerase subunit beta'
LKTKYNLQVTHTILLSKKINHLFEFISRINEKYSILLNRAPTLHRFGIQAFDPVIILGQAIHLHP